MTYQRSFFALFAAMALVACSNANTAAIGDNESDESGGSSASGRGGSSATGGKTGRGGSTQETSAASSSAGGSKGTGGRAAAAGGSDGKGGRTAEGTTGAGGATASGRGGSSSQSGGSAGGAKTGAGGAKTGAGGISAGTDAGPGAGGSVGTGGKAAGTGGSPSTDGGASGTQHWVGTWAASPYYDSANQPVASLANSVLRQVVHVSIGGSQLRVQFSNLSGNGPVTISSAHVALCKASPAVDSTIDTTTDKALAFSGKADVTIAQGKEIWSDPIDFALPALGNVTITTAFGSVPSNVVGHSGSRTTSYLQSGVEPNVASMASAKTMEHWYYIAGIDVMADASAKAVVAIGDSITDGRGTDTNKNNRWTDLLAARLHANAATAKIAVLNQGIGATNLVGSGTAAEARFARDVLGQSGVHYAIVYDGVNDIGNGSSFESMKPVYEKMISQAHAKGLVIYGATILPFGGHSYYTAAHEDVRKKVNDYIKSGAFDGYIDFDTALTDPREALSLQATYAQWASSDGLHPGPAGYQKMADSVDLTLFAK